MGRFKVWCMDISYPQHLKGNLRSRKMVKDRRIYTRQQVISLPFVCSSCRNLFSLYTVGLRRLLPTVISPWINNISWTQACVSCFCVLAVLCFFYALHWFLQKSRACFRGSSVTFRLWRRYHMLQCYVSMLTYLVLGKHCLYLQLQPYCLIYPCISALGLTLSEPFFVHFLQDINCLSSQNQSYG